MDASRGAGDRSRCWRQASRGAFGSSTGGQDTTKWATHELDGPGREMSDHRSRAEEKEIVARNTLLANDEVDK